MIATIQPNSMPTAEHTAPILLPPQQSQLVISKSTFELLNPIAMVCFPALFKTRGALLSLTVLSFYSKDVLKPPNRGPLFC